jgi:predicted peroxiredoxin
MKKVIFSLVVLAMMSACVNVGTPPDEEINIEETVMANDGIFVHISHGYDNPHRVLMGLNLAVMMSEEKDVLVYIDITGVNFVLKDAEDIEYSHFPSAHTSISKLIEKEVPVMVCPGCLKAAGKTAEDVMDGVMIADKDLFFDFTDGRILTIDY